MAGSDLQPQPPAFPESLPEEPLPTSTVATAAPTAPPAPVATPVPLLPRGVGGVVDTAITLYRRNARLLIGTVAVVIVPVEFLSAFLNRNAFSDLRQAIDNAQQSLQTGAPPAPTPAHVGNLAGSVLLLAALPFLTVALATAAASCYLGRPITIGQAWRATLRRFWAVLGLGLLHMAIVGFGTVFFFVPGVFLYIQLVLSPVALAVEGAGPATAIERSWRLVRRHWWRMLGVEVLKIATVAFALFLVALPLEVAGYAIGPAGWLLLGAGGSLTQVVVAPLVVVVTVVAYFDLRIRKEALDLAVGLQAAMPAR